MEDCGCNKNKVRFVSAQPATLYYAWQVEVMLNNFKEVGINLNQVDIVCFIEDGIPEEWDKLRLNYAARFFFYKDTRKSKKYVSSIRPNILKQHWKAYPELEDEVIFYHDCDIVFTKPLNLSQFTKDDVWYGSDTKWYISYDYIIGKGQDVFDKMVEVMDIDPQLVIDNNDNSIGAQYIMKSIDYGFWDSVEQDSENLFTQVSELNTIKCNKEKGHHPLQIWCADMWAVLWNGWKRGAKTVCHPDLNFAWATSKDNEWEDNYIFHNAGVVNEDTGLFYKAKYMNKLPYHQDLFIKEGTSSKKYYELIQQTEKITVLT